MRGASCRTDHQMVRSQVAFSVWKTHNRTKAKPPSRLNISELKGKETKAKLEQEMDRALRDFNKFEKLDVETQWKSLEKLVYKTAEKVVKSLSVTSRLT